MKKVFVKENQYYDSAYLMQLSRELKKIDGIQDCTLMMGTETNQALLKDAGYELPEGKYSGSDLLIAVDSDLKDPLSHIEKKLRELEEKLKHSEQVEDYYLHTLRQALKEHSDANLVLISVPGEYAAREARTALEAGKHVMLFSDNVSLEDEIELKKLAVEKGLLMMGPDCGTAIINGYPLAFANVVQRGNIGIVGASGTGIQEVSSIISRYGGGISQAIGTGGRDLKDAVGGKMMKLGLQALREDENTQIIVLISKPPSEKVADEILDICKSTSKPVIVNFLGFEGKDEGNIKYARNLTEAAVLALKELGKDVDLSSVPELSLDWKEGYYFVGLFAGGTLASEFLLNFYDLEVYSNIHTKREYFLEKYQPTLTKNKIIDLGEDEFTRGRPHPMIDPTLRNQFLLEEARSGAKVIVLDFVLGYGSHLDPVGATIDTLKEALTINHNLVVLASITGTYGDPQDYRSQYEKLQSLDRVYVYPTNQILAQELRKNVNLDKEIER